MRLSLCFPGGAVAVGLIGLLIGLGSVSNPAFGAGGSLFDIKIPPLVDKVQSGALPPAQATEACLLIMTEDEHADSLRGVLSTLLELSRSKALPAFCDALVKAAEMKILKGDDLRPATHSQDPEAESYAAGRLLRTIYFIHNGLAPDLISMDQQ
jgi:hypothetical protein